MNVDDILQIHISSSFWPDKSPCGRDVFKSFMLTKGSTMVFFRRANPKRCRIVNAATIWVGFLTFYCSIFLGFDCGKANVITKNGGWFFNPTHKKMGSQGLPHYIYIYMWYIYILCMYVYIYIYMIYVYDIYDNVIYWSPRSSPKHPYQVPGRRQSLPRCTTRREGRVCWGSLLISWAFHGNCCVILMGIPWFPWQFLVCRKGPQKVSLSWLVTWWTFRFVGNITILRWDCRPTKNLGASSCGNILIWWE